MSGRVKFFQRCKQCGRVFPGTQRLNNCECGGPLEFIYKGIESFEKLLRDREDIWRYFELLPVEKEENIISLGEGFTRIERIECLEEYLNGAEFYAKVDSENPTGTFKSREGSVIISRNEELGHNGLVYHSTGNTGAAYTAYAIEAGIQSFCFIPKHSFYKINPDLITSNNHFIAVDGPFPTISAIAKNFAKKNNLTFVTTFHEKIEPYTTLAYEQFEQLPDATMYVQTVSSGYGAIGFFKGHQRLVENNLEKRSDIPKIVCVQSQDNNYFVETYNLGKSAKPERKSSAAPFEPTLQSSNPAKNYPFIEEILNATQGLVTDAGPKEVEEIKDVFEDSLEEFKIKLSHELEKAPYIGFAGLVKLAKEKKISKKDKIFFIITGRAFEKFEKPAPSAIVRPKGKAGEYEVVSISEKADILHELL